ncbi:conserved protein of unknown function [Candidatus Filomicrobium marinum]|uniref:Uncharacterized protein n=1 Tax=Candidatus Filomicrobium marinum TaxID=1608628 RepID=A0A0D6JBL7_9HYPH|nr:hypothetical protein [Candidatus Filomicrobium marinum]CFX06897.1 conserved protein of unknown function [Candidatus Filomicrobium marinum]CPR16511.1 conserved protein of unknown function [Candidatus Filomicrobium marinum]
MAEPHVITALAKKRAELSGDIERTQIELRKMILDLERLDATLLMFDPDYEIASIKPKAFRPPEDWSKRGEMTRLILGILRKATEPLTSRDIATQLVLERALDRHDAKLLRLMTKRVGVALRGQRDKGVTVSTIGPGQCVLWRLMIRP